jgi:hypothetical protein
LSAARQSLLERVLSERVRGWLSSPYVPLVAALLSVGLSAHSLALGLVLDDIYHRLALLGLADELLGVPPGGLDLFRFMPGDASFHAAAKLQGTVPWWAGEQLRLAFFRPLASATHWLDYQLWPDHPAVMHLHNLAWMFALVLLAGRLYRRVGGAPTWVANLGLLMFAVCSAFALPVAWIANRSALMAEVFAVACLLAHDRGAREGALGAKLAVPLWLAASLACGEIGLGTVAYLGAYALLLDPRGWRRGALALLPSLLVVVVWRIAYGELGYGASGSLVYIDPVRSPGLFVSAVLERGPILLLRLLGGPRSQMAADPEVARVAAPVAMVLILLVLVVLRGLLRTRSAAWFWGLGALLCVVPACATFLHDRLLTFAALGSSMFVALALARALEADAKLGLRTLALVWLPIFLLVSPILRVIDGTSLRVVSAPQVAAAESLPDDLDGRTLVVVNVPEPLSMCAQLPFYLAAHDRAYPAKLRCLGASEQPVTVRRPNPKTLVLSTEAGYLRRLNGQLFDDGDPTRFERFQAELGDVRIQVLRTTDDGRPLVVGFYFTTVLESPEREWVVWTGDRLERFELPAIGQTITLPGHSLDALARRL